LKRKILADGVAGTFSEPDKYFFLGGMKKVGVEKVMSDVVGGEVIRLTVST